MILKFMKLYINPTKFYEDSKNKQNSFTDNITFVISSESNKISKNMNFLHSISFHVVFQDTFARRGLIRRGELRHITKGFYFI